MPPQRNPDRPFLVNLFLFFLGQFSDRALGRALLSLFLFPFYRNQIIYFYSSFIVKSARKSNPNPTCKFFRQRPRLKQKVVVTDTEETIFAFCPSVVLRITLP